MEGILRATEGYAALGTRRWSGSGSGGPATGGAGPEALAADPGPGPPGSSWWPAAMPPRDRLRAMFRDDPRVQVNENRREDHALLPRSATVTRSRLPGGLSPLAGLTPDTARECSLAARIPGVPQAVAPLKAGRPRGRRPNAPRLRNQPNP